MLLYRFQTCLENGKYNLKGYKKFYFVAFVLFMENAAHSASWPTLSIPQNSIADGDLLVKEHYSFSDTFLYFCVAYLLCCSIKSFDR